MDEELKDCPCCKSTNVMLGETEGGDWTISCHDCGITMFDDMAWGKADYNGRLNVITKWNRRVKMGSKTKKLIDTLKADLSEDDIPMWFFDEVSDCIEEIDQAPTAYAVKDEEGKIISVSFEEHIGNVRMPVFKGVRVTKVKLVGVE